MNRAITTLLSPDVAATAAFYETLLGMTRSGDFGWYVLMGHAALPGLELGVLDRAHDTVPRDLDGRAAQVFQTFVVENVEAIHRKARTLGAPILSPPSDLPYGQRRLLLQDPSGTVLDVSSPIPPRTGQRSEG